MMTAGAVNLTKEERRTFRLHLCHAILESLAAGILANAALMAVKSLDAADWQLTVPLGVSSLGMFAAWTASQRMARRDKRPFILIPFGLQIPCVLGMAWVPASGWFLLLAGIAGIFETLVRPAVAAFFRHNYRVDFRGTASGIIRGWCALAFMAANLGSAALMQFGRGDRAAIMGQMLVAAGLLAASLTSIGAIRMREDAGKAEAPGTPEHNSSSFLTILKKDRRFTTYLVGSSLFVTGGLLYVPLIPAVLAKDFGYGYLASALLVHVIPSLVAFVATPALGSQVDQAHPLKLWSMLRTGWGLDPLVLGLTVLAAPAAPLAMALAVTARCLRGACMGTTWVLWWLVGVNYFATPGANTSRYMGIQVFLNGAGRLAAAAISTWLLEGIDRVGVLFIGGALVMLSALHVRWQANRDPEGAGSLVAQEQKFQDR